MTTMDTAAIKVPRQIHRRLKDYADTHRVTMGAAIADLLDEADRRDFFARLEQETADSAYLADADDRAGLADAEAYLDVLERADSEETLP